MRIARGERSFKKARVRRKVGRREGRGKGEREPELLGRLPRYLVFHGQFLKSAQGHLQQHPPSPSLCCCSLLLSSVYSRLTTGLITNLFNLQFVSVTQIISPEACAFCLCVDVCVRAQMFLKVN